MPRLVGTGFPLLLSFWLFFVRTKDFPQPMERGSDMHRSLYGKAYIQRRLGTLFFFFSRGEADIVSYSFQEVMATVLEMLTTLRAS